MNKIDLENLFTSIDESCNTKLFILDKNKNVDWFCLHLDNPWHHNLQKYFLRGLNSSLTNISKPVEMKLVNNITRFSYVLYKEGVFGQADFFPDYENKCVKRIDNWFDAYNSERIKAEIQNILGDQILYSSTSGK